VAGSCEHGNEPSGSIKGGEFLDYLSVLLAFQDVAILLHEVCYYSKNNCMASWSFSFSCIRNGFFKAVQCIVHCLYLLQREVYRIASKSNQDELFRYYGFYHLKLQST
jgi:hypothetical protein